MKVRKIELVNNSVLGTISIDLTDNGNTVDTIIIAGENGCGKSYLLNALYDALSFSPLKLATVEKRKITLELSDDDLKKLRSIERYGTVIPEQIEHNRLHATYNGASTRNVGQVELRVHEFGSGREVAIHSNILSNEEFHKVIKSLYSDIGINYYPDEIRTVTSQDVDNKTIYRLKTDRNLATEITQLFVDIESLDAMQFANWGRAQATGTTVDHSLIDIRLSRFKKAFATIFPNKQFKGIANEQGKKRVLFTEFGRDMEIGQLSSGEKQIVFRGGFLLKDKESTRGAVVLIDEPEISMHPDWQLRILQFFKRLFTDDTNQQTSQIIIATHSPFIIHNTTRANDKVIVLRKNLRTGQTEVVAEPKFYGWTAENAIEKAFNISHNITTNNPVVLLEGETDELYFQKALEVFSHKESIQFKWVGHLDNNNQAAFTGEGALDKVGQFARANSYLLNCPIVLWYDNDSKATESVSEKLIVGKSKLNVTNSIFKKGSENLLVLPNNFSSSNFKSKKSKTDHNDCEHIYEELDKMKLCKYIVRLDNKELANVLRNFEVEIKTILSLLNPTHATPSTP